MSIAPDPDLRPRAPLSAPPPVGAGWARERLWLGMSNVGAWVVIAAGVLVVDVPEGASDPLAWLAAVGAFTLIQVPFDYVGGRVLPRRHGRPLPPLRRAILRWIRGATVHAAVLTGVGLLMMTLHDLLGVFGVIGSATFAMILVLALQLRLLGAVGGLEPRNVPGWWVPVLRRAKIDPSRVRLVDASDSGFVGGWTGLPGREQLVVPRGWWSLLSPGALEAQLVRRRVALEGGHRARGVWLALGWNAVGFAASATVFGAADAASLVSTVALFTLWSFLGLLLLPTPSRRGVMRIDRQALGAGASRADLSDALRRLDRVQDDEPARSVVVETIFHPVPGLERRMQALAAQAEGPAGAWHAARMALVLGWALGSPLSRAVHCNIGRPELWAMLPGD